MKSVSIVGSAPSTRDLAPYGQEDVWVLGSRAFEHIEKQQEFSRIFEIHSDFSWAIDDYLERILDIGKPVVVGSKFPKKSKNTILYPYEEVKSYLSCGDMPYLTSSIAYMIAMAILEGYKKISIFGVDMSFHDKEYFHQKACIEAWLGYAKALGIEIYAPERASILRSTYIYGIDSRKKDSNFNELSFTNMADKHKEAISKLDEHIAQIEIRKAAHEGSYQTLIKLAGIARGVESGALLDKLDNALTVNT